MGNEVTIDNGVATVRPISAENAAALLKVAGPDGVETITGIGGLAFRVSEKHAIAAGLVNGQAPAPRKTAAEAPSSPQEAPAGEGGPDAPGRADAPSRGASTADWRAFLEAQGVPHEPEATRADLIAAWDSR